MLEHQRVNETAKAEARSRSHTSGERDWPCASQSDGNTAPRQRDCVKRESHHMRSMVAMLFAAISLLALAGCERDALDRQMWELCKKDGGVKVYETVTLPDSEFTNSGTPLRRFIPLAKSIADYLGPDYRYVRNEEVLVGKNADIEKGEGRLTRVYYAIYRRSDGRLLGEAVWYGRGGGDGFTFGFQPSGNSCPKPSVDLIKSVFLKEKGS
jgi:hypothetical protein